MVMTTYKHVERRRRRMVVLLIPLIIGLSGYMIHHHVFREWSGQLESMDAAHSQPSRKTFYLRTDKGFDQIQPVEMEIPFKIVRLEWRSKGGTTFIALTLSNPISSSVKQQSAYNFQIWLNHYKQVVWLGHHLCPENVDETVCQPLVLDGGTHQVVSRGQVVEKGNRVEMTLPLSTQEVDAAQLYYIPSQGALRQAGGSPVMVSSLVHQRNPWGYRIRRLPVKWCEECTYLYGHRYAVEGGE
ncbi:MAG: hypothetical protein KatS3mg016_1571 [Fimbriimonadales bacterium]|nr:MAG: hypothetical protein KatS3mg016_1571 [Fimbriimonadales bacterium]